MKENYAGLIKSPDYWWLAKSRSVFDLWDLPDGPIRDNILYGAQMVGELYKLGPSSMSSMDAYAESLKVLGISPEQGDTFEPLTDRGRDFLNGTGDFAQEEEQ